MGVYFEVGFERNLKNTTAAHHNQTLAKTFSSVKAGLSLQLSFLRDISDKKL